MLKKTISEEDIRNLYCKERLTTFQIADLLGCSQATIWKRLKEFGIETRQAGTRRINLKKEELEMLYLKRKLSTWQIEKITHIPRSTIHRKLKEWKIATRDRADSHIIHPRKDFSGNILEKMYIIGFRIGDLGVRRVYPNSKTVCVASGSTIKEQIELIERIFKPYGRVWIKKANNKINIQVPLNNSFEFLLKKDFPQDLAEKEEPFFAFLAGFTDAEGHIGISRKAAYYSLGNYDLKLLKKIKDKLMCFGINCPKIITDKRKGRPTLEGYAYNADYSTLRINKKTDLFLLLKRLSPYVQHKNKIEALNRGLENVKSRL